MIGRFLEISIQTPEILESIDFYESLGFQQLQTGETWTHPYAVLSDGRIHLGLHAYEFDSPSLTFVLPHLARRLSKLDEAGFEFAFRKVDADEFNEAGLIAPDEQMFTLLEARTYSPGAFDPVESQCGRFLEYALPVKDLDTAREFWERLGFRTVAEHSKPHARVVMAGDELAIGLHDAEEWDQRALVFACSDFEDTIQTIYRSGIELTVRPSPVTVGDSAHLEAPEGTIIVIAAP